MYMILRDVFGCFGKCFRVKEEVGRFVGLSSIVMLSGIKSQELRKTGPSVSTLSEMELNVVLHLRKKNTRYHPWIGLYAWFNASGSL